MRLSAVPSSVFLAFLARVILCGLAVTMLVSMGKSADAQPPEAMKQRVWYQIYVPRFRNGRGAHPSAREIEGAWPHGDYPYRPTPWGHDWYRLQPHEDPRRPLEATLVKRRYGGDLLGVLQKIPYLRDLGIGGVYFNPLVDAPSEHAYDARSYHHINPVLGPDPRADRAQIARENPLDPKTWQPTKADRLFWYVVRELRANGIETMLDGVLNHLGWRSFAFRDVAKQGLASPFASWFELRRGAPEWGWRQLSEQHPELVYKAWFDFETLPELARASGGADLAEGPKRYIERATEYWMRPSDREQGISAWRLDVPFMFPAAQEGFWASWHETVRRLNPNAWTIAELWGAPGGRPFGSPHESLVRDYLGGNLFDGLMNYAFTGALEQFFAAEKGDDPGSSVRLKPSEFAALVDALDDGITPGQLASSLHLLSSHDTSRMTTRVINRHFVLDDGRRLMGRLGEGLNTLDDQPALDRLTRVKNNPHLVTHGLRADDRQIVELLAVYQLLASVGPPSVYYGEEVGMVGANDPCCRQPMVWGDLDYDPRSARPDGTNEPPEPVRPDMELHAHYKALIALRNQRPSLHAGSRPRFVLKDDERECLAFERSYGGERTLVVLNNSEQTQQVRVPADGRARRVVLDPPAGLSCRKDGDQLEVVLPPKGSLVLGSE